MMNSNYKNAIKLINESNSICIVTHVNPDGDAIGSSMAMYLALKNMNKDVHIIIPKYSDRFNFLEELNQAEESIDRREYDLAIVLDVSDLDRIAVDKDDFQKVKKVLMIDHHLRTKLVADQEIVETDSPATCQIVYELLESQNINIDVNIAKYIYLGILTDTGSFNYQRTSARTHRIVANLLETGINFEYICEKINDTIKENKLRLMAYAIDNLETFGGGKIKYVKVSFEVLQSLGIDEEDSDGIVNYLRSIEGANVAIYARGMQNGSYKVSLRSSGNIDISNVAIHFNGGGHAKAAGFTINGEIDKVKNEIIELVGVNL